MASRPPVILAVREGTARHMINAKSSAGRTVVESWTPGGDGVATAPTLRQSNPPGWIWKASLGIGGSLTIAGLVLGVRAGSYLWTYSLGGARRRVQTAVDHRFNRSRYDAAREAEAFATRLRGAPLLGEITNDFMGVVQRTLAPSAATIWTAAKGR